MPRRKATKKAIKKQPSAEPKTMTLEIEASPPENVASVYANHLTLQYRVGEELTVNLWQVPALAVDPVEGKARATFLGSFVMRPEMGDQLLHVLAEHLGYEVVRKEGSNGG